MNFVVLEKSFIGVNLGSIPATTTQGKVPVWVGPGPRLNSAQVKVWSVAFGHAGYRGIYKSADAIGCITWHVTMRPGHLNSTLPSTFSLVQHPFCNFPEH